MTTENLEKVIKSLQEEVQGFKEEIKDCKHEIERLQAINEIQNLMSRYSYLHMAWRQKDIMNMYAKNSPDVKLYWGGFGSWNGPDAPNRGWGILDNMGQQPGLLAVHPMVTPLIIVAGDGKTAKGVWTNNGFVTGHNQETHEQHSMWEMGIYGVDFIKEDGEWKFWHFHMYRLCRTGWDGLKDWDPDAKETNISVPDEFKPDGPGDDDAPYRKDQKFILKPDLPEPYETWKDTFSY